MLDGSVTWKLWKGPYQLAEGIKSELEAEYLSRVVNNHDALLELVKEWVSHRQPIPKSVRPESFMGRALKAIARAEGKE
jgi:hypothetical protein